MYTHCDLTDMSTYEACCVLLEKLDIRKNLSNPYCMPFARYVTSWCDAVPIRAIVMGQSPYPNDIFPYVASAMSYDEPKCVHAMKKCMPPTVEVLGNDVSRNARVTFNDVVTTIRDGWLLVDRGVLLVNSAVFHEPGSAGAFRECVDQCGVLSRLLLETEKYGRSVVHVFAMGSSGQKMASDLSSRFKSTVINVAIHRSKHPASLSYKYSDLRCAECTLGNEKFSSLFWQHVCNQVAPRHITAMAPKSSVAEARLRTIADGCVNAGKVTKETIAAISKFEERLAAMSNLGGMSAAELEAAFSDLCKCTAVLKDRFTLTSAAMMAVSAQLPSIGAHVAKPAPSLARVAPSSSDVTTHEGMPETKMGSLRPAIAPVSIRPVAIGGSALRTVPKPVPLQSAPAHNLATALPGTPATTSGSGGVAVQSGNTPSTGPATPARAVTPIRIGSMRSASSVSAADATTKFRAVSLASAAQSPLAAKSMAINRAPVQAAVSVAPRPGTNTAASSRATSVAGEVELDKHMIQQLSCVEAVVCFIVGKEAPESMFDKLNEVYTATRTGVARGEFVQKLVHAIGKDMRTYEKFDFSSWAYGSHGTMKPSEAYDICVNAVNDSASQR